MKIRVATPDDAGEILAIYRPFVEHSHTSFELVAPSLTEMQSRIRDTLPRLPWLVGVDPQGTVCGYVYASRHRERAAYLWAVDTTAYVREDMRRAGVGRNLYAALFEQLMALGYYQAFAGIALPNAASVRLHEAIGFESIGVYRKVGFKLGNWHDVGWWQKSLLQAQGEPQAPREFNATLRNTAKLIVP